MIRRFDLLAVAGAVLVYAIEHLLLCTVGEVYVVEGIGWDCGRSWWSANATVLALVRQATATLGLTSETACAHCLQALLRSSSQK